MPARVYSYALFYNSGQGLLWCAKDCGLDTAILRKSAITVTEAFNKPKLLNELILPNKFLDEAHKNPTIARAIMNHTCAL